MPDVKTDITITDSPPPVDGDNKPVENRKVNIIWELTQAMIAIAMIGALIVTEVYNIRSETLANGAFLIIGFYFGKTPGQRALSGVRRDVV